MPDEINTTYETAERVLSALKELELAATPRNIELLYTDCVGKTPGLSRDIAARRGENGPLAQSDADALFDMYIDRAEIAYEDVAALMHRFESEVGKLAGVVQKNTDDAKGHNDELQVISGALDDPDSLSSNLTPLVESVIRVVRSVREANRTLATQLADSAEEISYLRESVATIQKEAMTDALTGVKNRKAFDDAMEKLFSEGALEQPSTALIIADVDHFKRFNDQWGHQTGDQVLKLVASLMKANVKGQDLLTRYGGEEFALILPDTTLENAVMLANRMREAIGSRALKKRRTNETVGSVTMSMGVALLRDTDTAESLIERADNCLYAAKERGRNMVVADDDEVAAAGKQDGAAA